MCGCQDSLSTAFQAEILEIVLPSIQEKLQHSAWEHQEAGVLALGAIASGKA